MASDDNQLRKSLRRRSERAYRIQRPDLAADDDAHASWVFYIVNVEIIGCIRAGPRM
jgi:hypothetical protein